MTTADQAESLTLAFSIDATRLLTVKLNRVLAVAIIENPNFLRITPRIAIEIAPDVRLPQCEVRMIPNTHNVTVSMQGDLVPGTVACEESLPDAIFYGLLSTLLSARLTTVGCAHINAAGVIGGDFGMLLAGAGKSTTVYSMAQLGYSLLSEDTVAVERQAGKLTAYGVVSDLFVDPRNIEGAGGMQSTSRATVKVDAWVPKCAPDRLIVLRPGVGSARIREASVCDAKSCIAALILDRAIGRSKFIGDDLILATWATKLVDWSTLEDLSHLMLSQCRVYHLDGDITQFGRVLDEFAQLGRVDIA